MNNSERFPRGVEIVGSAIIENNNGEILLTQQPKWKNKWLFPGGHIDPGETIKQAVLREVKEEVGIKNVNEDTAHIIAFGELINSEEFHRSAHFIYFDLYCVIPDGEEVKLDEEEIKKYIWVRPEKALEMDMEKSSIKSLKEYLKFKKQK